MKLFNLVACALLLAAGCDGGSDDGSGGPSTPTRVTALFGVVRGADGAPLAGVRVEAGSRTATTDDDGRYQLRADAAARVVLRFTREGYVTTVREARVMDDEATAADATLVAEAPAVPIDADLGGEVVGERGEAVVAPAGAFVTLDGASVSGMVDVHVTPIDPARDGELNGVSGDFLAVGAGGPTLLESFGMLDVTVRQDGEKLQVADGATLQIRVPAPQGLAEPPPSMPLWSFDEAQNRWVEEGTATWDAAQNAYVAEIGHMSAWNVDRPAEATCITGVVKDPDGAALAGARVNGRGLDYFGSSETTAGEDGRFYLAVRRASRVSVLATHQDGGGQVREVASGDAPTAIPPGPGDDCKDVGEWVVERGVVRLSDGSTVSCDTSRNPWEGTCADGLFAMLDCYAPEGACELDVGSGAGSAVIRYENGSSLTSTVTDDGVHAEFRGPDGDVCGTVEVDLDDPDADAYEMDYVLADGTRYTLRQGAGGASTITCPDGGTVTVTADDQAVLDACGGQGSNDGSQCTYTGPSTPGQCEADADCEDGMACCTFDGASAGFCLDRATCDAIQDQRAPLQRVP